MVIERVSRSVDPMQLEVFLLNSQALVNSVYRKT